MVSNLEIACLWIQSFRYQKIHHKYRILRIVGKRALAESDGVPTLLSKLSTTDEDVLRLTLICITNVAEDSRVREEFQELGVVPFIKKMHSSACSDEIKHRLAHAIRQLDFGHWPYEKLVGSPEDPDDNPDDVE